MPETPPRPITEADKKEYMDFSTDYVARVRAAKAAAQREMESFGDVSEYDVVLLQGQLKDEPATASSQASLDFQGAACDEREGAD